MSRSRTGNRAATPRKHYRAWLEQLEDRVLLSAVSWAVDHDGFWDDPNNWSNHGVPGSGDDVTIHRAGALTVTIRDNRAVHSIQSSSPDALALTAGSLTVAAASQLDGPLTLSGGRLTADGPITLTSPASRWGNGTLAGNITNTGTLTLTGVVNTNHQQLLTGTLTNAGTITEADADAGQFRFSFHNGTLNNLAGALFDIQTDVGVDSTGTDALNNAGTIRKSVSTGFTQLLVPLNNAPGGVLDVRSGALTMAGNGASSGGTFTVATGAVLELAGRFTTQTLTGTYTGSGGGTVALDNGTLQPGGSAPAVFNFPAGLFQWTNGTLNGIGNGFTNTGFLTINGLANISHQQRLQGTLNNAGTLIEADQGAGQYRLSFNNGTLNNLAGGLFDIQNDINVDSTGADAFNNAGTIRKSGQSGTSQVLPSLNNTGIVEAASGTLQFNGAVSQVTSTTLSGGTWVVDGGSTLDLHSTPGLTTNKATVTLTGPGATFRQLGSLAGNAGSFSLLGGAGFNTGGDLANSGSLTLGPGSTLRVAGNYSQTSGATLNVQVGGTPASGQFGQLNVQGQAALDDTLAIVLANGFGPTAGQAYPILSFAGHTGDFAAVTGLGDGRTNFFSETTNPTGAVLNAITSSADLAVTHIDPLPPTGVVGQNVTIHYTVQDLSATPAHAPWIDSVYLSSDGTLNPSALLLGRVRQASDVAGHSSYAGTLTAPLPAVLGKVHVIVVADSRGLVPDANRANNVKVSTDVITATVQTLDLGSTASGMIGDGQDVYYRVDVPPGQDVQLDGSFAVPGAAELYERYQSLPDRATFDQVAFTPTQARQQILLSATQAGPYYILLHGREGAGTGQRFSLTATALPFQVRGVGPARGANAGPVTLTVSGDNFSPNTTLTLVAGATRRAATSVLFKNSTTLFATFDLTGLAPGTYDLRADDGERTATATGAFTVIGGVAGHAEFFLDAPTVIRPGQRGTTVLIEYSNPGDTDVPAPLILLQSDNARFRLPGETAWIDDEMRLLAINTSGPAGTLPPGYHGTLTVEFQPRQVGIHVFSNFTLSQARPTAAFDWTAVKKTLQPAGEPDDAWDAVFANLTARMGATLGQLQTVLDKDATYLSSLGEYTPAASRLLAYEVQQADAFGAITRRYTLGGLGRGFPDPTDLAAVTDAAGNVALRTSGLVRTFTRQADGSYQGVRGDFAALTLVGGVYQLREKNGLLRAYNPDGTFNYSQDTSGNRITAGYTGGRLTSFTDSFGNTVGYTYNGQGRIATITDPVGRVTTLAYDAAGEHLRSLTDNRGTVGFTYITGQGAAREHALDTITYRDGSHLSFTYDPQGRLIHEERDGGAEAVDVAYDDAGRATVTDAAGGKTVIQPNDFGQLGQALDSVGRAMQAGFDANHDLTVLSSGGLTTTVGHDGKGNPTHVADPLGQNSDLTYNPTFNSLTSFRDPLGHTLTYTRDGQNHVVSLGFPDGSSEQYAYDPQGRVVRTSNRRGQAIRFTYDAHSLLLRKDFADGSHEDFTYDAHRNLHTVTDATGTTTFDHDPATDLLLKVSDPTGRTLEFRYGPGGRRERMFDQAGFTVVYGYEGAGRLETLHDGTGALIARYHYDPAGRVDRADYGNGTATRYGFNAAGQMLSVVNLAANGTTALSSFTYTYDPLGRPVTMTTLAGTFTYGYDADGQLISVTAPGGRTITYQYDAGGNRVAVVDSGATTAYAANSLNEYTSAGPVTFTYDDDGNLVTRKDATGTTSYSYDARNRLVGIVGPAGTWSFEYNALGQRTAQTHNGVRTEYVIDPSGLGNVVGEYQAGAGLVAHYTDGLGLTSRVDAGGTAAFYGFDGTGNTVQLTDPGGTTLDSYSYLPFGEHLTSSGTTPNPFTFVGQFGVQDDGSGLYFMRHRYYDAGLGRFTAPDPLGLGGGDPNLYRYVGGHPVQASDPSGLEDQDTVNYNGTMRRWSRTQWDKPGANTAHDQQVDKGAQAIEKIGDTVKLVTHPPKGVWGWVQEALKRLWKGSGGGGNGGGGSDGQGGDNSDRHEGGDSGDSQDREGGGPLAKVGATSGGHDHGPTGNASFATPPGTDGFCAGEPFACGSGGGGSGGGGGGSGGSETPVAFRRTEQRTSNDPNDITGPAGFGPQGFVRPEQTFPYTIFFQNKPNATAPAQVVTVTQQLDTNLDLSTFQLGNIGFGTVTIPVPAGRTSFSTRFDARATLGLFVDVTAGVNLKTGLATWTFTAIDPKTLDVPIPVLEGFLPPDATPPQGEGFVTYTVQPKVSLATGTVINARATIVFDANASLDTAPIFNTIDAVGPTSSITGLPATTTSAIFTLSWSGQDDVGGSGIASFDVFVSDNGGAFQPFLLGTTQTSAAFNGSFGHTYGFFSVATDNVGHRQATPSTAQATIFVTLPAAFVGTPTQQFVVQLYRDLLARDPEKGGLAFWSGIIDQHLASRVQVALDVENSPEYRVRQIDGLYHRLLGRPADPRGMGDALNFLAHGGSPEQLQAALMGSPEYFQKRGGGTNAGFVEAAYRDLFGQAPDAGAELAGVLSLGHGTSRTSLVLLLLESGAAEAKRIQEFFALTLHRPADAGGFNFFLSGLEHGLRDDLAIAILAGSDEYLRRATGP